MDEQLFKVWITKHALTSGIKEVEVRDYSGGMVVVENSGKFVLESYHGEGKEWHKTKEDAIKRANVMKNAKLITLEKQIQKLKSIEF